MKLAFTFYLKSHREKADQDYNLKINKLLACTLMTYLDMIKMDGVVFTNGIKLKMHSDNINYNYRKDYKIK